MLRDSITSGSTRLISALALLVASCSSGPNADWDSINRYLTETYPDLASVTTSELAQLLESELDAPLLLDARQPEEYAVSHLPGALLVQSRLDLGERIRQSMGDDLQRDIVVYCSVGVRSASVAQQLVAEGFMNVRNLRGSIFQWANQGLPLAAALGPTEKVHPYDQSWGVLLDRGRWSFGHQAD